MRCNDLRLLKVDDIDSQRKLIHIRNGKGQTPRDVTLSPVLLERLRIYWRWRKPQDWLFPSKQRPDHPMESKSIRCLCANAGRRAPVQTGDEEAGANQKHRAERNFHCDQPDLGETFAAAWSAVVGDPSTAELR